MNLITIKQDWPIRVAKHKVLFRKAYPLTEFDRIILSFLDLYNDTISYNELGSILGFAVEANEEEQVYFDIAEAGIFSSLLDTLSEYHLISTYKNEDGNQMISTTKWGLEAREKGVKHLFYEGVISLNEHYLLFDWESFENLFNFSKYGLFSEIFQAKEVKPYYYSSEDQQANVFLHKALLNFNSENEEHKNIEIQWVHDAVLNYEKCISNLSLSLLIEDDVYRIQVALNDKSSPELDEVILKEANSHLLADWILLLRYQLYLRDIKEIHAVEISQYTKHVNWQVILSDSRVVWDNNWFELLSSEEVSSNAVWYQVIQNCPDEILILNIEAYTDYWDWSRLSKKVEIPYILNAINQFPWDIDVFLERIDQKELEQLLTTITDVNAIEDWKNVTKRVSFEFIEREIQSLPFDLHTLISFGEMQSGNLILNNPHLSWDWSLICSTYSINYFILNLETLSPYIDTISVVNRLLKNEADFKLSFNESKFGSYLIDPLKRTNFKIGKDQDVILNSEIFEFLSDNDLLFWGNENIPGIEANQNLKWSSELFDNFSSLVKNQAGYNNVSNSIDSISIVDFNETFPWNFSVLCNRKDLKWTFEFIRKHQDKLALNILINSIPSELVADNLAFFIQWAVEKEMLSLMSKHVSTEFTFEQILLNRELLNFNSIAINWVSVLREVSVESLNEIVLTDEAELLQLPSAEGLRNYLSAKCDLDFILDNPDLFWDWNLVTKDRISSGLLLDDEFQVEYASYIYWPYLIDKFVSAIDLTPTNKLPSLAVLISQSPESVINYSWSVITKKILPNDLWKFIKETIQFDIFTWDWNYISSSKYIPIDHSFLSTYSDKINWKLLSSNSILSSFFQFSKVVYRDTRQWLDRTLEYLYAYKEEWDFTALSSINNITWNERIISEFEDKWDWHKLSAESPLLTNSNKEKRITEYDARRLNRFSSLIDWGALSIRYEVTLYPALVSKFSNHPWDWEKLSSHPRFELTKEFILENRSKPWDYHALSSHSFFKVDKDVLLQLQDKDWDYNLLSKASWIDNDTLRTLSDKQWNWQLLSSSKNLIFDLNLLRLFVQQSDSNWSSILNSDSIHITPDTIKLLVSNNVLNNELWVSLSSHQNLDFQQHPDLLLEYKSKWDWITLVRSWKLDFNNITILSSYQDSIDWNLLCESEKFSPSPEILLKFKEFLNWKIISGMIVFDINGLRLFKDFLDWEYISQNTSINFTIEMVDEFMMYWDYFYLKENISIPLNIREHIIQIVNSIPELELYLNLKAKHSSWSGYIYHFTHLTNAIEIIKNKKILSRNKAIGFADAAGAVVGRRHTAHEFARFYFRPQTPTQFYNECLGLDITDKYYESALRLGLPKCPIPVFFRFNLQEVLLKMRDKCYMSNGNMQTNWAVVQPVLQMLSKFNFSDVYSTIFNTSDGDYRTYINYSQQEFLIKDEFDFTSIINFDIIVRNEKDKEDLIRRIGERSKYANRIKVSSYSDDIYHNQNKDIECEYSDGILDISTNYIGNGYKSGMFIVQFPSGTKYELISGNVINATESMICAYPSLNIKFENHTSLKVYFQDEIKNTKWELYNLN